MSDDEQPILTERRDHVLVITMNRPQARNAFDAAAAQALEAVVDELDADDGLFAAVITGAGGTFSAGADLKAAARGERASTRRGGFGLFAKPPRKPLIAAVEGYAVGGGFELCLACDLIVAATTAQFGLPEVRHNLVAVGGGLFRLPRRMPYHLAMEMALTGEFRDADYMHRFGVVNRVVPEGEALEAAAMWAKALLVNGPTALAATKEIMYHSPEWTDDEAWGAQMQYARRATESEDRHEGLKAFAEKRKPVWTGR
jgi:enoyl-CoA hydratase